MQWTQTEPFKLRRAGSLQGFRKEGFIPVENKQDPTNSRNTLNGWEAVNKLQETQFLKPKVAVKGESEKWTLSITVTGSERYSNRDSGGHRSVNHYDKSIHLWSNYRTEKTDAIPCTPLYSWRLVCKRYTISNNSSQKGWHRWWVRSSNNWRAKNRNDSRTQGSTKKLLCNRFADQPVVDLPRGGRYFTLEQWKIVGTS